MTSKKILKHHKKVRKMNTWHSSCVKEKKWMRKCQILSYYTCLMTDALTAKSNPRMKKSQDWRMSALKQDLILTSQIWTVDWVPWNRKETKLMRQWSLKTQRKWFRKEMQKPLRIMRYTTTYQEVPYISNMLNNHNLE